MTHDWRVRLLMAVVAFAPLVGCTGKTHTGADPNAHQPSPEPVSSAIAAEAGDPPDATVKALFAAIKANDMPSLPALFDDPWAGFYRSESNLLQVNKELSEKLDHKWGKSNSSTWYLPALRLTTYTFFGDIETIVVESKQGEKVVLKVKHTDQRAANIKDGKIVKGSLETKFTAVKKGADWKLIPWIDRHGSPAGAYEAQVVTFPNEEARRKHEEWLKSRDKEESFDEIHTRKVMNDKLHVALQQLVAQVAEDKFKSRAEAEKAAREISEKLAWRDPKIVPQIP